MVPFVADFLLISTYPAYMNETADTKQEPYSPNDTLALILTSAQSQPCPNPKLIYSPNAIPMQEHRTSALSYATRARHFARC